MKDFGEQSAFIVLRSMAEFAIKQADLLAADKNVRIYVPDTARRFCRGEGIQFKDGRELILDPIGEGILATCEDAEELARRGGEVKKIVETAKITIAEVLTDILLRENYKGTQVPGELKVSFLRAFNSLLQYKFLGGEEDC